MAAGPTRRALLAASAAREAVLAGGPTRRAVLAGSVAAVPVLISGCRGVEVLGTPPPPAPDVRLLRATIVAEQQLISRYHAVLAGPGRAVATPARGPADRARAASRPAAQTPGSARRLGPVPGPGGHAGREHATRLGRCPRSAVRGRAGRRAAARHRPADGSRRRWPSCWPASPPPRPPTCRCWTAAEDGVSRAAAGRKTRAARREARAALSPQAVTAFRPPSPPSRRRATATGWWART